MLQEARLAESSRYRRCSPRLALTAPSCKAITNIQVNHLSLDATYPQSRFFSRTLSRGLRCVVDSYRKFVADLTDICEALRFEEDRSKRGALLESLLQEVNIPECGYLPLCRSTEPFHRVIKITPDEAKAFSTKVNRFYWKM